MSKLFAANVQRSRQSSSIRKIAVTAMLGALSAVLMFVSFPIPMLIPPFIKLDFSEFPALVASFVVSPLAGVAVCLIKNVVNLFTTTTAGVGELCNFLLGACMVLPAGLIYKHRKTRSGAAIACVAGTFIMGVLSVFINYYITYPAYALAYCPMDVILDMYRSLNPSVSSLWDALIWFNMPFTLVKGFLVSVLTFIVYKPLSNALKKYVF